MKYYAVIDTNVLVSALLKWDSIPGTIMEFVFQGTILPLLNESIAKEYQDVLSRPKFHLTEDIISTILSEINQLGIYLDAPKTDILLPDPKDAVFYEIVMKGREKENAYLITGNIKHFPVKPYVVTPRQMLDIILQNMEKQETEE